MRTRVKVDAQGRVLIPAELRQELGIEPGDTLTLSSEDGQLSLLTFEQGMRRVRELASSYVTDGRSVVDEFIAERREEASRE